MYRVFVPLALVAVTAIPAIAQDASARTVQYHSQDIVPIRAKLKYTTLIESVAGRVHDSLTSIAKRPAKRVPRPDRAPRERSVA